MITGYTRVVTLLGWPTSHSLSPQMHNAALVRAGIDARYVASPVDPDRLGDAVRGLRALGFVGANVTIPHKVHVVPFMDRLTPQARMIGAVNTIRVEHDGSLTGHNTDCEGAVRAMEADGTSLSAKTAIIVGAGGAARGVAVGCALAGAARVIIVNRTHSRAEEVADELRVQHELSATRFKASTFSELTPEIWHMADAVFQTTSVGMGGGHEVPFDVTLLCPRCHLLEAVYVPRETALLAGARARGLRTTDGLAMLVAQGAASFQFWFGQPPDIAAMRAAIE